MIIVFLASVAGMIARPNTPCRLLPSNRRGCWHPVRASMCCPCLGQGFVGAAAAVMMGTVGEEEVDDEANDGEDEDA